MANIEKFIPFVIKWETGCRKGMGETPKALFERARKYGWANDKDDHGGATQTGLTIASYRSYCKRHGISEPTTDDLRSIPYETWRQVMKEDYWDKWKADQINNQSVANMLVDWVWASGVWGVKKPQAILGVHVDGIVGKITLSEVNAKNPVWLFNKLVEARHKFVEKIVSNNPSQEKWLRGWKNRIDDIKYIEQ